MVIAGRSRRSRCGDPTDGWVKSGACPAAGLIVLAVVAAVGVWGCRADEMRFGATEPPLFYPHRNDALLQQLYAQKREAIETRRELLEAFGPGHPSVQASEQQIELLNRAIASRQRELESARGGVEGARPAGVRGGGG